MANPPKAIIIGSGVAGLACAIRLAVQGFEVTIYEKNNYPGGKLTHFEQDGYSFDAGPSLFTEPANIEALFALANEPIEPYFQYQTLPISCKYFYEDGTVINAYANNALFAQELATQLGENATTVQRYLQEANELYQHVANIFLHYSLHEFQTLLQAPIAKAIATVKPKHLFKTMHGLNEQYFTHPHTIQLFNRYATYNGSNPYQAPGMLSLIAHLEHNIGSFYPKGGMISITNALFRLAKKKGVCFKFNQKVDSIVHHNGHVQGVLLNNELQEAAIVVSNMDVYYTYQHLLGNPIMAKKILQPERSSSALIFYWGINKVFPQLELHNIFFSDHYKAEFDCLFKSKTLHPDPTVYVNITAKCEPGIQAPNGKENWFVMINAPANIGQDWQSLQQQAKQAIITKLNRILSIKLEDLIETESVLDPVTIDQKTASYMGSLYGTSSNSANAAFLRHPNFSKNIKGLYFAGGSVHPGGGIPLCLKSAEIVANMVQKQFS